MYLNMIHCPLYGVTFIVYNLCNLFLRIKCKALQCVLGIKYFYKEEEKWRKKWCRHDLKTYFEWIFMASNNNELLFSQMRFQTNMFRLWIWHVKCTDANYDEEGKHKSWNVNSSTVYVSCFNKIDESQK